MTNDPTVDIDAGDISGTSEPASNRSSPRKTSRTAQRSMARGEFVGRNGEVLKRAANTGGDEFTVPEHLKEAGWDYQWLTERIYNNADIVKRHNHQMYQNGWRPVLAQGRWNGVFGPVTDKGPIVVGDSALYERPLELTKEARKEDVKKARTQMSDRDQSLMGGKADLRGNMPGGFAMNPKYRGAGGDIRMAIDPALDAPSPSYQPADDSQS